MRLYGKLK